MAIGLALLATGCALMSEADCRGADWYELGRIEGEVYGIGNQIDQHTHHCGKFGVAVDAERYNLGWVEGNREFRLRAWFLGGGED